MSVNVKKEVLVDFVMSCLFLFEKASLKKKSRSCFLWPLLFFSQSPQSSYLLGRECLFTEYTKDFDRESFKSYNLSTCTTSLRGEIVLLRNEIKKQIFCGCCVGACVTMIRPIRKWLQGDVTVACSLLTVSCAHPDVTYLYYILMFLCSFRIIQRRKGDALPSDLGPRDQNDLRLERFHS